MTDHEGFFIVLAVIGIHHLSKEVFGFALVHYCTLSMTECRVGTPYMRRNFIDGPPKASVDQSGPSFLQKLHLGYVPGPQKKFGDHSTFF